MHHHVTVEATPSLHTNYPTHQRAGGEGPARGRPADRQVPRRPEPLLPAHHPGPGPQALGRARALAPRVPSRPGRHVIHGLLATTPRPPFPALRLPDRVALRPRGGCSTLREIGTACASGHSKIRYAQSPNGPAGRIRASPFPSRRPRPAEPGSASTVWDSGHATG